MANISPKHLGETLSAFLDGELDAEDTAQVEQWLREDRSIRDQLDILRRTVELVRSLPRHRAPETLAEDLQTHLERSDLTRGFGEPAASVEPRRTPLVAVLSTAAVFAVIAGGMWFMAPPTPDAGPVADSVRRSDEADATRMERLVERNIPSKSITATGKRESTARRARSKMRKAEKAPSGLLVSATLEQKLAAGMGIASVPTHSFANEPLRLHLKPRDAHDDAVVTSRLLSSLRKIGLIGVSATSTTRAAGDALRTGLFYRGIAHQNFGEGGGTQILVRASPRQLNDLLLDISHETEVSSMSLSSGPLVVRGVPGIRTALARLGGQDAFAGDPLGALASVLGVEQTATPSRSHGESGATSDLNGSKKANRSTKRKSKSTVTMHDATSPSTSSNAGSYVTLIIEIANDRSSSAKPSR